MAGRARASKVGLLARLRTDAPGQLRVLVKGCCTASHWGPAVQSDIEIDLEHGPNCAGGGSEKNPCDCSSGALRTVGT